MNKYLYFKLDNKKYMINSLYICEIITTPQITKVPRAKSYCKGLINIRGNIMPLLLLQNLLFQKNTYKKDFEIKQGEKKDCVIVIDYRESKFAYLIDEVIDVKEIDDSEFIKYSEENIKNKMIMSVEKIYKDEEGYIFLLDLETLEKLRNDVNKI